MTTLPTPDRPAPSRRAGQLQSVRYRLPAGLADEILREAQRRNISPSSVVTAVLAHGLATFAAAGVAERLEHAIKASVDSVSASQPADASQTAQDARATQSDRRIEDHPHD